MSLLCVLFLLLTVGVGGFVHRTARAYPIVVRNHRISAPLRQLSTTKESLPLVESFGKGVKDDISRKKPFFWSDFKDGIRVKSLSSTFFLFFACLAPAVAFGGLLTVSTGGMMGTVEALGATAIGGFIYALLSGQPITIIGTTGPLLAFLKVLYSACASRGIPFLPVYAWTGLWSSLLLYLSAFFSTSNVVDYFTKFTDDIFSTLISVIYPHISYSPILYPHI